MDRPSFKKDKISSYNPTPLADDVEIEFSLNEDKILHVLEPFANVKTANNTVYEFDDDLLENNNDDDEILAYNKYFRNQNRESILETKYNQTTEIIKYTIQNGVEIYVDKSLNLKNSDLVKMISNALI